MSDLTPGMTSLKDLKDWCCLTCAGYPNVEIRNMSTSFRDGLVFCAIIHRHRPDLIDFSSLSRDNVFQNNKLAFEIAETKLGIPALLDPNDFLSSRVPDCLSIITYLYQYYHFFNRKSYASPVSLKPSHVSLLNNLTKSKTPAVLKTRKSLTDLKTNTEACFSSSRPRTVCSLCFKPVHLIQRYLIDGKVYHRSCFRCRVCHSTLLPGSYTQGSEAGFLFCSHHTGDSLENWPKSKFKEGYFSLGGSLISSVPHYTENTETQGGPVLETQQRDREDFPVVLKSKVKKPARPHRPQHPPAAETEPSDRNTQQEVRRTEELSECSSPRLQESNRSRYPIPAPRRMLDPSAAPVPSPRNKIEGSPTPGIASNQNKSSPASSRFSSPSSSRGSPKVRTNHPWLNIVHPGPWTQLPPAPPPIPAPRTRFSARYKPKVIPLNPFAEDMEEDNVEKGTPKTDALNPFADDMKEDSAARGLPKVVPTNPFAEDMIEDTLDHGLHKTVGPNPFAEDMVEDVAKENIAGIEALNPFAEDMVKNTVKENMVKESLVKENRVKENVVKENVVKENVLKESLVKENVVKENVVKENVVKENVLKESLVKENVEKENVVKENVVKENVVKENMVKENVAGIVALNLCAEDMVKDVVKEDMAKEDIAGIVALNPCADDMKEDVVKEDMAKEDIAGIVALNPCAEDTVEDVVKENMVKEDIAGIVALNPFADDMKEDVVKKNMVKEDIAGIVALNPCGEDTVEDAVKEDIAGIVALNPCAEDMVEDLVKENVVKEDIAGIVALNPCAEDSEIVKESEKTDGAITDQTELSVATEQSAKDGAVQDKGHRDAAVLPQRAEAAPCLTERADPLEVAVPAAVGVVAVTAVSLAEETLSQPVKDSSQGEAIALHEAGNMSGSLQNVTETAAWTNAAPQEAQCYVLPRSLSVPAMTSSPLPVELIEAQGYDQVSWSESKLACKENPFDRNSGMPKSKTFQSLPSRRGPAPGHGFPLIKRKVQTDQNVSTDDLRSEMRELDTHLQTLEQRGVQLEKNLRDCKNDQQEEQMLTEWFSLVREKNSLVRRDTELIYLTKQQKLEERQADVEYKLRCLLNKPEGDWSEEDRGQEQQLMDELVTIIEERNEIISNLDQDRIREREEDVFLDTMKTNKELQKEEPQLKDVKKAKRKFKPTKVFKLLNHKAEGSKDTVGRKT